MYLENSQNRADISQDLRMLKWIHGLHKIRISFKPSSSSQSVLRKREQKHLTKGDPQDQLKEESVSSVKNVTTH